MTQSTPPGWYPDGQGGQRWWDGNQWTEHTVPPEQAQPQQPAEPEQPPTSDRPAASEPPAQPGPSDVTQVRPPADRPAAPEGEQPPAALPTQVAGPGATGQPPAQQSGYAAPPQQGYQPGYPGQPGQPGQPAWQGQQFAGASAGGGINVKLIGIIAGAAIALIVVVVVLVTVLGGGGPKGVVEDFIDADSCSDAEDLVTDDFEEAFGECTEDQLAGFEGGDEGDFDLEVKNEEIDGDTATVDLETSGEFEGEEISQTITFSLVKEDGDWKIDGIG